MIHYFIDCVRNNKEPEMNGELGKKILKIIWAAYKSYSSNAPIILE
jgi:hypothetical protein